MATPAKIVRYSMEVLIILGPLLGVLYFLFDPDAFNAFLDWLTRAV
jgi:hypothetical protein